MDGQQVAQFLVDRGILTDEQLDQVARHRQLDRRPLWRQAAELTNLSEADIWEHCARAIAQQSPQANLFHEPRDPSCLSILSARDAWEHLILPLRVEDGELVCATTRQTLAAALPLMLGVSPLPCRFVLVASHALEQFIAELYDYEGVDCGE